MLYCDTAGSGGWDLRAGMGAAANCEFKCVPYGTRNQSRCSTHTAPMRPSQHRVWPLQHTAHPLALTYLS